MQEFVAYEDFANYIARLAFVFVDTLDASALSHLNVKHIYKAAENSVVMIVKSFCRTLISEKLEITRDDFLAASLGLDVNAVIGGVFQESLRSQLAPSRSKRSSSQS